MIRYTFTLWCLVCCAAFAAQTTYTVTMTKYHPNCSKPSCRTTGLTYTGRNANSSGVAIHKNAPKWLRQAKEIRFKAKGKWSKWVRIDDRGPGHKGNKQWIDWRCGSHSEALEWGVRKVLVQVR